LPETLRQGWAALPGNLPRLLRCDLSGRLGKLAVCPTLSLLVALRRPGKSENPPRINEEYKERSEKTFVLFVSSRRTLI
jgi:hypothetical protein